MDEELRKLRKKRGDCKAALTRFMKFLQSESSMKLHELDARLKSMEANTTSFNAIQDQIDSLVESDEEQKERIDFEEAYFKAMGLVNRVREVEQRLVSPVHSDLSGQYNMSQPIKFPSVELPKFNGKISEFQSFSKSFKEIISSNNTLSSVQKFLYLKSSLSGSARSAIDSIEISEKSYDEAWALLESKFQNSKLIADCEIRKLLSFNKLCKRSYEPFQGLLENAFNSIRKLKNITEENLGEVILVYIITSKFDTETKSLWEQSLATNKLARLSELEKFMEKQAQTLNAEIDIQVKTEHHAHKEKGNKIQVHASTSKVDKCTACNENHRLFQCNTFLTKSIDDRISFAKLQKLCLNCLNKGHFAKDCKFGACKHCQTKHNTLLHKVAAEASLHTSSSESPKTVLLATAEVYLRGKHDQKFICRALLDTGSHSSFISEETFQRLQLKRSRNPFTIDAIANMSVKVNGVTSCNLSSIHSEFSETVDFIILPKITSNLPASDLDTRTWNHLKYLNLADKDYYKSKQIDILLGADIFFKVLESSKISGSPGTPDCVQTKLGWIVVGSIEHPKSLNNLSISATSIVSLHTNLQLENAMKKFWECEDLPDDEITNSDDDACITHFKNTHQRDENGRFIVKFPFLKSEFNLGDSLGLSLKRFSYLQRKLNGNDVYSSMYSDFIRDYIRLGHMEETSTIINDTSSVYYLPHHGVFKESSLTTKLRVVFDGSAHTSGNPSINDILPKGPKLQNDLIWILLKFRFHKIAIVADIEKMFRQVLVHPDFRDFQRIVFKFSPNDSLKHFRLCTVTYGMTWSTYISVLCLVHLARENMERFPVASKAILTSFFVDDATIGADTIENATLLYNQLNELLSLGCFKLRKWASNDKNFLDFVNKDKACDSTELYVNNDPIVKTLGLIWNTISDTISLPYDLTSIQSKVTKRIVLSELAKIFDPFGFLSPFTVRAKILIQKLWQLKLAWDDDIPPNLQKQWFDFRSDIQNLSSIKIPRLLDCSTYFIEIHGFGDASETAFGFCIYLRIVDSYNNLISTNLLLSKTKVAPLKSLTIPKLELSASHEMAKAISKLVVQIHFHRVYAWSDSKIVLAWIKKPYTQFKVFVANRVKFIQSVSVINSWGYVESSKNPADKCSRGCSLKDLNKCELWWHGPDWLLTSKQEWLASDDFNELNLPEQKLTALSTIYHENTFNLIERYSSLKMLLHVASYCLRPLYIYRSKQNKNSKVTYALLLSSTEMNDTLNILIRLIQREHFANELRNLRAKVPVSRNSKLSSLCPFIDDNEIVRVGGRLQLSDLSFNEKHPIILPNKNHLTKLIAEDCHLKNLHAPPSVMIAILRSKYWIIDGRRFVKSIYNHCVACKRAHAVPRPQIMGNLPSIRVKRARPFLNTGIDYGGPFSTRASKGRSRITCKSYLALFICFSTRAVHLEVVSDLSGEAFIAALRRFISRRGVPAQISSDNGRNFLAASKYLSEIYTIFQDRKAESDINNFMLDHNIKWNFNPAYAPNFGGLWEAGIKSVKSYLKTSLADQIVTFEELSTLFAQIECILNSRPLTPLFDDPDDLQALTPGHFLIGEAMTNLPDMIDLREISLKSRWNLMQQKLKGFWKAWHANYLLEMQRRVKWRTPTDDLKQNDFVLIKDGNVPLKWHLGRVVETHPGSDLHTRVVTIKTTQGQIKRAINKIIKLPVECSQGGEYV